MGSRRRFLVPLLACAAASSSTVAAATPPSPASSSAAPAPAPTRTSAPPPAPASTSSAAPSPSPAQPPAPARAAAPAKTPTKSTKRGASTPSHGRASEDSAVRRMVAGGPTVDDASVGADTPELRALWAAERELFPPASPALGAKWPDELPFPLAATDDRPRVHASGLPPAPPRSAPPETDGPRNLAWLSKLELPDLPVRWDPRVVRYLEFFKDDPRGRSLLTKWLRRSGRYRDHIRKVFKKKGLPEDLTWLAMIESGFDATARSPVGALGLWQFMPDTGKIYGLSHDRWSDQRMSLVASTEAAADFLADLYRRFGSWDLAMAGYNMGYGGVLAAVRRYNTNDYWALAKLEGSLPWETTLYVPKILAAAIVAKNLAAFGFQDVVPDPPLDGEEVPVAPGTSLATVAQACGTTTKDVELLNPELRASRTPPTQDDWMVRVPVGKAAGCERALTKTKRADPGVERYVVRFGETLEQIAQARRVSVSRLVEINAIAPGEVVRGGTVLLVPKVEGAADKPATAADAKDAKDAKKADKPVVVVPQDVFVYPDRRRVFYRVQVGDTVRELCTQFKVSPDDVRRWNGIDTSARLVEGMTVQLFVPRDTDLSRVVVLSEGDVRTVVAGTDEFLEHWDDKGRRRLVVHAQAGDTLASIGKKHGVSTAMMERINRRGRSEKLAEGDAVVVWAPGPNGRGAPNGGDAERPIASRDGAPEPIATPPLANPPNPELLPALP